jgi:hypothetical protein
MMMLRVQRMLPISVHVRRCACVRASRCAGGRALPAATPRARVRASRGSSRPCLRCAALSPASQSPAPHACAPCKCARARASRHTLDGAEPYGTRTCGRCAQYFGGGAHDTLPCLVPSYECGGTWIVTGGAPTAAAPRARRCAAPPRPAPAVPPPDLASITGWASYYRYGVRGV